MAAELMVINPTKRRKRKTTKRRKATRRRNPTTRTMAKNPAPRRRRRRSGGKAMTGIMAPLVPSFQGALGGLAVDAVMGYAPIPANLRIGNARHMVKGGIALLLGVIGTQFARKNKIAANMAIGGLTVAMHDAGKEMLARVPGIRLGEVSGLGYIQPDEADEIYDMGEIDDDYFDDDLGAIEYDDGLNAIEYGDGEYMDGLGEGEVEFVEVPEYVDPDEMGEYDFGEEDEIEVY